MADEKLNTGQEENSQPSLFDAGPAGAPAQDAPAPEPPAPENTPEQAAGDAPAQDAPAGAPGEVNVSADQIEKLMAERRAAERAEVEKNEPPEPEQPPTPAPEEKAAGEKGPAKKDKAAKEKAPEPDKPKGRRGRKPKEEKAGLGEPGGTGARRGRPAKADKAATDKPPAQPRDKMSQGKGGKAATVKGKEEAPAAPPPAPEVPPQPRDATRAEKEEIIYLNLSELFPFKDHPFGVRDDAEMKGLVESVKDNGVHQPALVRPREGGGYEIIAGHRRQRASELAGFANMPCIVRNMTDDEAILAMTDDNLRHREKILPMEKAQSLKMQVEAISHQGAKLEGVAAGDVGKRSTEIVGERNGMNYKQVQRYIRLTELVPELQSMVNEKKLSFTPAMEISFIRPKNQKFIAVSIEGEQASPSLSQAQELLKLDKDGKLNGDVIDGILSREKKEVDMEHSVYTNRTNFYAIYGDYYFSEYQKSHSVQFAECRIDESPTTFSLNIHYANREELEKAFDELCNIQTYMDAQEFHVGAWHHIYFESPLCSPARFEFSLGSGVLDLTGIGNSEEIIRNKQKDLDCELAVWVSFFQLHTDWFTEEELTQAFAYRKSEEYDGDWKVYIGKLSVWSGTEQLAFYPQIAAPTTYAISFQQLYQILSDIGWETLEGNKEQFFFTGADGVLHQFSCGWQNTGNGEQYNRECKWLMDGVS